MLDTVDSENAWFAAGYRALPAAAEEQLLQLDAGNKVGGRVLLEVIERIGREDEE
jgi:hypothetical protein